MARGQSAARSTSGDVPSVLGRGARVRGRIGGDGDLRIEGQVEGDVSVSGELSIEEGASVTGDVAGGAVVVGGALRGDVTAHGAIAVRATAEVAGNLSGAEVSLDEGASFHGRIEAEFDMPAELEGGKRR
jgi:cytoskeletal protein CcmA (bactofilin family)